MVHLQLIMRTMTSKPKLLALKLSERHCVLLYNLPNYHMGVPPNCRYLYPANTGLEASATCHSYALLSVKTLKEISLLKDIMDKTVNLC